jgi:hypothetical protein
MLAACLSASEMDQRVGHIAPTGRDHVVLSPMPCVLACCCAAVVLLPASHLH